MPHDLKHIECQKRKGTEIGMIVVGCAPCTPLESLARHFGRLGLHNCAKRKDILFSLHGVDLRQPTKMVTHEISVIDSVGESLW